MQRKPWGREEFEGKLRALDRRYHIHHPYHRMMASGELDPDQIRGWVANRFYYQVTIPRKDAALMANCPDRETRRLWIQRIVDHDGRADGEGGIEAWVRLGEACGLDREELWSMQRVLPGVRFAVDAYLRFVRDAEWHDGVCSSLTELFAPKIHRQRLENWPRDYPWIESAGLDYFPEAGQSGQPRCGTRPGGYPGLVQYGGNAATCTEHCATEAGYPVVHAGCHVHGLRPQDATVFQ